MEKMNSLLIVDDDAANLMELASILKSDYKIYAVKDGAPALEKAHEALPDLILLDVVMPDMNGFEVLAELKRSKATKDIPVIFITGVNDSDGEREGLAIGAVDYIRKPFDTMVVKHRVRLQIQIVNLQRELETAAALARAASQSKSSFLANMSHEIRTPMNAIMGITDILLQSEKTTAADITDGLNRIYTSCEMLLNLINDILDFSKIEAGKLDILPIKYRLASMISDTIHLNIMRIENKPITFDLQIEEDIPAKLIGDELRIKQILNNLLSNAFKYTNDGKVTLSVSHEFEPDKDYVTLLLGVTDTGHGMTNEQLDRLFDEYSRFNEETTRSIEGTGLGLAIMKHLVNLMNGNVHVESEPGKGTSVKIRLPQGMVDANVLGNAAAEELKQFKQSKAKQKETKKIKREPMPYGRVLIVDDVETNLFVAVRFMKPYKLKIDTAVNGLEAIEMAKSGDEYDAIFMDHMMPEMDGMEATKQLRESGYTAPIVALTANAMTGQADVFLQNGFDDFISKPIDIRRLDSILIKLIKDKQPPEVIEAALLEYGEPDDEDGDLLFDEESGEKNRSALQHSADPMLIESFMNDARKAVAIFEELQKKDGWFDDEKDLSKYTITIHGMKSILGCIGEVNLSDFAMALESGAREMDRGVVELGTPEFLKDLRELMDYIEQTEDMYISGPDEDFESLCNKLFIIEEMCADYDRRGILDALQAVNCRLKKTTLVLDRVKELVLHSEFEEAGRMVAEYAAELSPAPVKPVAKAMTMLLNKHVDGLDIQKGLDRYDGIEEAYLKTLRSYAISTGLMLDEISTVTEETLGDYKIKVHGIKGASYDIQAGTIGEEAAKMEDAADSGDYAYVSGNNPAFLESARKFIGDIVEMLSTIDAENPKPKKDKPDEDLLRRLLIACESYSMDDVDSAMSEIEHYQYDDDGGLVERLRHEVDLMQFPKIVAMLTEEQG